MTIGGPLVAFLGTPRPQREAHCRESCLFPSPPQPSALALALSIALALVLAPNPASAAPFLGCESITTETFERAAWTDRGTWRAIFPPFPAPLDSVYLPGAPLPTATLALDLAGLPSVGAVEITLAEFDASHVVVAARVVKSRRAGGTGEEGKGGDLAGTIFVDADAGSDAAAPFPYVADRAPFRGEWASREPMAPLVVAARGNLAVLIDDVGAGAAGRRDLFTGGRATLTVCPAPPGDAAPASADVPAPDADLETLVETEADTRAELFALRERVEAMMAEADTASASSDAAPDVPALADAEARSAPSDASVVPGADATPDVAYDAGATSEAAHDADVAAAVDAIVSALKAEASASAASAAALASAPPPPVAPSTSTSSVTSPDAYPLFEVSTPTSGGPVAAPIVAAVLKASESLRPSLSGLSADSPLAGVPSSGPLTELRAALKAEITTMANAPATREDLVERALFMGMIASAMTDETRAAAADDRMSTALAGVVEALGSGDSEGVSERGGILGGGLLGGGGVGSGGALAGAREAVGALGEQVLAAIDRRAELRAARAARLKATTDMLEKWRSGAGTSSFLARLGEPGENPGAGDDAVGGTLGALQR